MAAAAHDTDPDLLDFIERQFAYVHDSQYESGDNLLRWVTVLTRLDTEPRIRGILEDLEREGRQAVDLFNEQVARLRSDLLAVWREHRSILEHAEKHKSIARDAFGRVGRFAARMKFREPVPMPGSPREDDDPGDVLDDWRAVDHWRSLASASAELSAADKRRWVALGKTLRGLREKHDFHLRRFQTEVRTAAGPALYRLRRLAHATNPAPLLPDASLVHVAEKQNDERLAVALHRPQESADRDKIVREATADLIRDTRILLLELRARVGLTRSRLGLLQRFVARCQTYDSARLRELVRQERKKRRAKVESVFTLELARFLFEQGLNPLVDPTIAGLRPDIFEHAAGEFSLYVEAKQYSAKNPRAQVVSAVRQVFDTWQRLRPQYPVHEAFLVVFRLGGPLVIVDDAVRGDFGTLHIQVADIAPTSSVGSGARLQPVKITAAELAPITATAPPRRKRRP